MVTVELVRDHLAYCLPSTSKPVAIVTMSGLRGIIENDTLSIRSALPINSKAFRSLASHSLASHGSPNSVLQGLAPLPQSAILSTDYPSFGVQAHASHLTIPPASDSRPPLPPRPGQRVVSSPASTRLTSALGSLFSKSPAPSPANTLSAAQGSELHQALDLPAYIIDKKIVRPDVEQRIAASILKELQSALAEFPSPVVDRIITYVQLPIPDYLTEETHRFATPLLPSQTPPTPGGDLKGHSLRELEPDALADVIQDLFEAVEKDLRNGTVPDAPVVGGSNEEEPAQASLDSDESVRRWMDLIESVLCNAFYDL